MSDIMPLIPRQPVPALTVPLVGGGRFDIDTETPERFSFRFLSRTSLPNLPHATG